MYMIGAKTNAVKFDSKIHAPNYMSRFEFMETLVRIAKGKYPDEAVNEGLEMLFAEIFESYREEPWGQFRANKLWKLEINDVFYNNMEKCKTLMKRYHEARKATFTLADCTRMCLTDIDINITATDVPWCWGMSKMTVTRETKMYGKYECMELVEFYEFIARMADRHFRGDFDL